MCCIFNQNAALSYTPPNANMANCNWKLAEVAIYFLFLKDLYLTFSGLLMMCKFM